MASLPQFLLRGVYRPCGSAVSWRSRCDADRLRYSLALAAGERGCRSGGKQPAGNGDRMAAPQKRTASLSGPFPADEEKPFTLYGGISEETDEEWELFYIPNNLGFSLDADALYQENKSVSWNEQYARQYQIHYTTNFHLVFSVEPAD